MFPNIVSIQYQPCPAKDVHLHVEILLSDTGTDGSPTASGVYAVVGVQAFDTEQIEVDVEASGMATDSLRFQILAAETQQVMASMTPASREAFEQVAAAAGIIIPDLDARKDDDESDEDDDIPQGQYL